MSAAFTLVSHALCPYVQRVAIALAEKRVEHDRVTVDLANKPAWFLAISPLGRTPVLTADDAALFESAAILEFLEETQPRPLLPSDPVTRALHRAWIGFGGECLDAVAAFYSAPDTGTLDHAAAALHARFRVLEGQLGRGPWFADDRFGLVDVVYAPVFRYFDTFDRIGDFGVFDGLVRVRAWRAALARRPSVRAAVAADHDDRLTDFLSRRSGALGRLVRQQNLRRALSA